MKYTIVTKDINLARYAYRNHPVAIVISDDDVSVISALRHALKACGRMSKTLFSYTYGR